MVYMRSCFKLKQNKKKIMAEIGDICCVLGGKADGKLWGWGEGSYPLYMSGTLDLLLH